MEFRDFDDFLDGVEDSFDDLNLPLGSSVAKKNYKIAGEIVFIIAAYSHSGSCASCCMSAILSLRK